MLELLENLTELSHTFGGSDYVIGGGGNVSVKEDDTLWIKPSGTALAGVTSHSFTAVNRKKLAELYSIEPPAHVTARELFVNEIMAGAVSPGSLGRPSVEAPVHNSFSWRYVVHTHPAIVNGMTCAVAGEEVCGRLFPDALWVEYVDPGYTLCTRVHSEIEKYKCKHGSEPTVVLHQNHGVFVAGDSSESVQDTHATIMRALEKEYRKAGIETWLRLPHMTELEKAGLPKLLRTRLGDHMPVSVCACGSFPLADGPVSPDHVVYSRAHFLRGEPTPEAVADFERQHGYPPAVLAWGNAVFGLGRSENAASLALKLAQDGALVVQLAEAFGGIQYMSDEACNFIENWEVEAYRRTQI